MTANLWSCRLNAAKWILVYVFIYSFHFLRQPDARNNMRHWLTFLWHKPSPICQSQRGSKNAVTLWWPFWTRGHLCSLSRGPVLGFPLEVNIHSDTRDGDWNEQLNKPLQIPTRELAHSLPQFLRISAQRVESASASVSVGGACGPWHCWEPSVVFDNCVVCACVCMVQILLISFAPGMRWITNPLLLPPLPSSLVWIARLISHSPEGLEGNESWQHNGIVSADGEPKS